MLSKHYKSGDTITVKCLGDQTFSGVELVVVDSQGLMIRDRYDQCFYVNFSNVIWIRKGDK